MASPRHFDRTHANTRPAHPNQKLNQGSSKRVDMVDNVQGSPTKINPKKRFGAPYCSLSMGPRRIMGPMHSGFPHTKEIVLTVCPILVECNHFAQERKDIFGRKNVVESFRFHPTQILLFLKQIEFYYKF